MRPDLGPHHVGDIVPFTVATCDHLEKPGTSSGSDTQGAIFKDGQLAWLLNGASLEVVSTRTGERHASWEFGAAQRTALVATCAEPFQYDNSWKLVVGTSNGTDGGAVCLFDVKTSRLLKTIAIPEQVTCVGMVSTAGGVNPLNCLLADQLRFMYGVVAVGTGEGCVYLLDLELEQEELRWTEESVPADIDLVYRYTADMAGRREDLLERNEHLALLLNDGCFTQSHFLYKSPDNSVSRTLSTDDICVTAISYVHQTASLLVGFNFGGFQIWTLDKLQLVYTSALCEVDQLPVVRFTFQEPENDPRNFCYVWVVNGTSAGDPSRQGTCFASLYSLTFARKDHVKGMGHCYRDMQSCLLRFDFDLCHEPGGAQSSGAPTSRLVACSVIKEDVGANAKPGLADDTATGHDELSRDLCVFVWETSLSERDVRPRAMLAVFDLNQWYLAQMPSQLRMVRTEMCSYMGFFSMAKVSEKAQPDVILDVHVPPRSICRVQSQSTDEPLFFPSSLALETCCLIETGIVNASFLGLQRQIIYDLKRHGPSLLLNPKEVFNVCAYGSLLGSVSDSDLVNSSVASQRDAILSLALEHNLVDFVVSCIRQWSHGRHSLEGCTLRFLQEWAWRRVTAIKSSLDRQCSCLYDCSGLQLSTAALHSLHSQATQLKHLEFVFRALLLELVPTTELGVRELEAKVNVISLLTLHLEVVLWFVNCQLLPENAEGEHCSAGSIAYPYSALLRVFTGRRAGLRRLNGAMAQSDLLMIDGLVSQVGDSLLSVWSKEGGDGHYPPPSLHALLNIYLLDEVDSSTKHRIVQYLFLDLAHLLDDDNQLLVEQLIKFAAAFSLSPSLTKMTQAFWLLDHREFEDALTALLHPMIGAGDILPWQHQRVMKAFLYQGEAQKALRYMRVRKPALSAPDEVRFHLTLLLANGLVPEAFHYQRENRDRANDQDLLRHFFLGAEQTKQVGQLLKLSLCPWEESQLMDFLRESGEPRARELLIVYFLQRSRYVEAMRVNERLQPARQPRVGASTIVNSGGNNESDPAARERAATRDIILDGFARTLPRVQNLLTQTARDTLASGGRWQQVVRPQPLSTCVRANQVQPMSKATLIGNVMEKIAQMWSEPPATDLRRTTPLVAGTKRKQCEVDEEELQPGRRSCGVGEYIPLVSTPTVVNRRQSRSAAVVFPALLGSGRESSDSSAVYASSPAKKSRYMDASPLRLAEQKRRSFGGVVPGSASSKYLSAEAMSLLQTPPVKRRTPVGKSVTGTPGAGVATPHSILKVRGSAVTTSSPAQLPVPALSLPSTPEEVSSQSSVSSFEDAFPSSGRGSLRQLRFGVSLGSEEDKDEVDSSKDDENDMSLGLDEQQQSGDRVSRERELVAGASSPAVVGERDLQPSPRPPLHGDSPLLSHEVEDQVGFLHRDVVPGVEDDQEMMDAEEDAPHPVTVRAAKASTSRESPKSAVSITVPASTLSSPPKSTAKHPIVDATLAPARTKPSEPRSDVVDVLDSDDDDHDAAADAPATRGGAVSSPRSGSTAANSSAAAAQASSPAPRERGALERTTPCMPPAGLDLGEVECAGVEVRVGTRDDSGPFPASFSSLLDRTIPSFLEGVPCAVDKELALSSLSRGLVPTERRFLKQHHTPDPARRGQQHQQQQVEAAVKKVQMDRAARSSPVSVSSSDQESDESEPEEQSTRRDGDGDAEAADASSSSSVVSDSSSSAEQEPLIRRERPCPASRRRVRTLSQVVADMEGDTVVRSGGQRLGGAATAVDVEGSGAEVAPAPALDVESFEEVILEDSDGEVRLEDDDLEQPEEEEVDSDDGEVTDTSEEDEEEQDDSIRSDSDSDDNDHEEMEQEDEPMEIASFSLEDDHREESGGQEPEVVPERVSDEEADASTVPEIPEVDQQSEAVVPDGENAVVPQVMVPPPVSATPVIPARECQDAIVPEQEPCVEEQPTKPPPPPASPSGPRTRRQSQQALIAATHPPKLPELLVHVDTDAVQTRSRTRQQSGSTVSSLSPRQASPAPPSTPTKRTPPKSVSRTAGKVPELAGPSGESPPPSATKEVSTPPRTPSSTTKTRRPMPRSAARALRRLNSGSRPATPFNDPEVVVDQPLEVIGEVSDDPWHPHGMRLRLGSHSSDPERTMEMRYEEVTEHAVAVHNRASTSGVGGQSTPTVAVESGARQTRSSSRMSNRSESSDARPPSTTPMMEVRQSGAKGTKSSPKTPPETRVSVAAATTSIQNTGVEAERQIQTRSVTSHVEETDVSMIVDQKSVSPNKESNVAAAAAAAVPKKTPDPKKSKAKMVSTKKVSVAAAAPAETSSPKFTVIRTRKSISTGNQQSFSFATPTIVAMQEEEGESSAVDDAAGTPKAPQNTFIFSPPLTRSRLRVRKPSQEKRDDDDDERSPSDERTGTPRATKPLMKPPKTPRMAKRSLGGSKSESPIGFRSPPAVGGDSQMVSRFSQGPRRKSMRQSIVARAHKTLIQTRRSARFQ